MDCTNCANNWPNNMCRSMERKPKIKWCHMSVEQAVKAEMSIISYIEYSEERLENLDELKNLRMAKTKAYSRIRELGGCK